MAEVVGAVEVVAVEARVAKFKMVVQCGMMSGSYGQGFVFISWATYILFIILIMSAIYWLISSANKDRRKK